MGVYSIKFVGDWRQDTKAKVARGNLVLAKIVMFAVDVGPLTVLHVEVYVRRKSINPFRFCVQTQSKLLDLESAGQDLHSSAARLEARSREYRRYAQGKR